MLNTCLTVKANQAGSHSNKGWETFTDKVVDVVDKFGGAHLSSPGDAKGSGLGRGVVFLAWGAWAAKRVGKLSKASRVCQLIHIPEKNGNPISYCYSEQTKHLILKSAVSNCLVAYRSIKGMQDVPTCFR
jgi:uracil DNA glycosylase